MFRALALFVLLLSSPAMARAEVPGLATLIATPAPTAASPIYDDPAWPGTEGAAALAAAGYVRQEYFVRGAASVYGHGPDGTLAVKVSARPYVTRIVVLRPADPGRFSGNVQLSSFHPLLGSSQWSAIRGQALGNGDVIFGVMVGADPNTRALSKSGPPVAAPLLLKWFDPVRYAPIQWPDDDGVRWDVFAQAAALARSGAAFPDLKVQHVYASGWSFDGSFLRTYINEGFHDRYRRADGGPLIDGYLIGISAAHFRSGYLPINSASTALADDHPRRTNRVIDSPVIELMSENEAVTNIGEQRAQSDSAKAGYRIYEVPGSTHALGPRRETPAELQLAARGHPYVRQTADCNVPETDVRLDHLASAALANLDLWVRTGEAPPRVAERFRRDPRTGEGIPDAVGNSLGGVRAPQIALPLARYGDPPGCVARQGLTSAFKLMRRMPLDRPVLDRLYPGGAAVYLARFDAYVDDMVRQRWLRPAEAADEKAAARGAAAAAFSYRP